MKKILLALSIGILSLTSLQSATPVAAFTGNTTSICVGDSVTFTDTSTNTPTSWAWTTTGGSPTSNSNQNQTVVYSAPGTYTVSLTATNASGSDTATKTSYINVNALPTVIGTTHGNTSGAGVVSLSATASTGTVNWYAASTGGSSLGTGSPFNTPSISATTTYYVEAANGSCLSATRTAVVATVNELTPPACTHTLTSGAESTIVISGQTYCIPSTSTYSGTITVFSGGHLVVCKTPVTGILQVGLDGSLWDTPTTTYAGVFSSLGTRHTNEGNCSSATAPSAAFLATDTTICVGESVTFNDESTNNPTSWSWTNTGGTPSLSTSQNQSVTYSTAGTYSVSLTATNSTGSNTETKTGYITVSAATVGGTLSSDANVCSSANSATLTLAGHTGSIVRWESSIDDFATSTTIANTTTTQVYLYLTATTKYRAVVQSGTCSEVNSGVAAITVNSLPNVNLGGSSAFCAGSNHTLDAGPGDVTYVWNDASTAQTLKVSAPGEYFVTVTTAQGCIGSDTAQVTENANPIVTVDGGFTTDYDILEGNVTLAFGLPTGGTYSGTAVTGGVFNTATAGNGSYLITYDYIDPATGCAGSNTTTLTVSTTTAVAGVNGENVLSVSPNPFNGHLNVTISSSNANYTIVDTRGKVSLAGALENGDSSINTESLALGVYHIVITGSNGVSTTKVVKSR